MVTLLVDVLWLSWYIYQGVLVSFCVTILHVCSVHHNLICPWPFFKLDISVPTIQNLHSKNFPWTTIFAPFQLCISKQNESALSLKFKHARIYIETYYASPWIETLHTHSLSRSNLNESAAVDGEWKRSGRWWMQVRGSIVNDSVA